MCVLPAHCLVCVTQSSVNGFGIRMSDQNGCSRMTEHGNRRVLLHPTRNKEAKNSPICLRAWRQSCCNSLVEVGLDEGCPVARKFTPSIVSNAYYSGY
ncbi:hypothetical protein BS17DRAFT_778918 [Gyrodon lividus]|nr:hypothetical protein BS17DRAFT_778918 [Gyrodon lividus]